MIDLDELIEEIVDWTPVTKYGEPSNQITHGRSFTSGVDEQIAFDFGIEGPIHHCKLARLKPGGFITPHCDEGMPHYWERWHVPLVAAGFYWEEGFEHPIEPQFGIPFLVRHHVPHAVWNPTDITRIHLMVDREVVSAPGAEYQRFDMIPEIEPLLAAVN